MSLIKDLYDIYKDYISVTIYERTPQAYIAAKREQRRRKRNLLILATILVGILIYIL